MAKKVEAIIKLQIKAGQANPSPPTGPALGSRGVNIMAFCKEFNERTQKIPDLKLGTVVPVEITVMGDKSFTFIVKSPPAAVLLKEFAKIQKGSGTPNTTTVGMLSRKDLEAIAKIKEKDLNAANIDAAVRIIAGTARSMGIDVEGVV